LNEWHRKKRIAASFRIQVCEGEGCVVHWGQSFWSFAPFVPLPPFPSVPPCPPLEFTPFALQLFVVQMPPLMPVRMLAANE
jgi:hypothetical protein